jgi:hypothetical protein
MTQADSYLLRRADLTYLFGIDTATPPWKRSCSVLLVRHMSWHYEAPGKRDRWQGPCRGQWVDFNGGGWSWSGHMGTTIAWRTLP